MSRIFGPIVQNGYVVRDLDRAMNHWIGLGVGPFYVTPRVKFAECRYRGQAAAIEMGVALAYSGELQIELIQPLSDSPSVYRDHLARFGEGLHHAGVVTGQFEHDMARLTASGFEIVQDGLVKSSMQFAYLDCGRDLPGTMVEIIEGTPDFLRFLARLKEEARLWDGGDPIRGR